MNVSNAGDLWKLSLYPLSSHRGTNVCDFFQCDPLEDGHLAQSKMPANRRSADRSPQDRYFPMTNVHVTIIDCAALKSIEIEDCVCKIVLSRCAIKCG